MKIVLVSLLISRGFSETNGGFHFPKTSLGDKRSPDVGHSETAKRWQVKQGKRGLKKSRVLAVERAPTTRRQTDRCPAHKIDRQRTNQAKNGVHVRISVGQSLLD